MHSYTCPHDASVEALELKALNRISELLSEAIREAWALAASNRDYHDLRSVVENSANDVLSEISALAEPIEERLAEYDEVA